MSLRRSVTTQGVIRAVRERNAGNHAEKTSPRHSMGCRGRGEDKPLIERGNVPRLS